MTVISGSSFSHTPCNYQVRLIPSSEYMLWSFVWPSPFVVTPLLPSWTGRVFQLGLLATCNFPSAAVPVGHINHFSCIQAILLLRTCNNSLLFALLRTKSCSIQDLSPYGLNSPFQFANLFSTHAHYLFVFIFSPHFSFAWNASPMPFPPLSSVPSIF